jgi:GAF domain-containing protein
MNNKTLATLCSGILNEGRSRFDAMLGIVSRIEKGQYEVFAVSSDTGIPDKGDCYPLSAVFCRDVFEHRKTFAITEIDGVQGMRLHPLYETIPCEFYLGSPIFVDGKVWGTLNFTSLANKDVPFSAADVANNEANALKIALAITEAGLG